MKKPLRKKWFFQLNPPLRVGEILLRNVKSSLCSGEIAAAVGGFNFICEADFIRVYTDFIVSYANDFIKISSSQPIGWLFNYICRSVRL